jgi:hypothetical protein
MICNGAVVVSSRHCAWIFLETLRNTAKNQFSTAGAPVEIRNKYIRDTDIESFHYSIPLANVETKNLEV